MSPSVRGSGSYASCWRRTLINQRGQGIVELGIILVVFISLTLGVIEFSRQWLIVNMIAHAARDGARMAAVIPVADRVGGIISDTDKTRVQDYVTSLISIVMDPSTLTPDVTQTSTLVSGNPTVTVTVSGTVPNAFSLFGSSFTVNRAVTVRDEGV